MINVDLTRADLRQATLYSASLSNTLLLTANLSGLDLRSVDLSGADLTDAILSGANLSGNNLRGIRFGAANLRNVNFQETNLSGADLSRADLKGANFSGANLSYANLAGVDLSSLDLSHANLEGAILSGANLSNANLQGANAAHANLESANLRSANFREANLSGASIAGAVLDYGDFRNAYGLTDEMLDTAGSLVNGTLLEPRSDILAKLGDVCRGESIERAANYQEGKGNLMVLLSSTGERHPWTDEIPDTWEPTGIRFAQLVVCAEEPHTVLIETCGPYFTLTGQRAPDINRYRYQMRVQIYIARTGKLLASTTLYGNAPRECRPIEKYGLTTLVGDPIPFSRLHEWLRRYAAP